MSAFAAARPLRLCRAHVTPTTICQSRPRMSAVKHAVAYTTGVKLLLQQAVNVPPDTPRYIVCPKCSAAYVGNALVSEVQVKCPKCRASFRAAPTDLYTALHHDQHHPPTPTAANNTTTPWNSVQCQHMSACPGCTLAEHVNKPPVLRHLTHALRNHRTPLTVEMAASHAWRTHAKLAVRPVSEAPALGLFQARSHDLVRIPNCAVHAPEINAMALVIEAALRHGRVRPYDDRSGSGLARYVLLSVHRATRKVQVTIVWNVPTWKESMPLSRIFANEIIRRAGRTLHSLWFNWNNATGNAITCPEVSRFYKVCGEDAVVERMHDVDVYFPPYAFRQANLDAFDNLILPRILGYIREGSRVAEFCAGVGAIGLIALKNKNLGALYASEINEGAERAFYRSVKSLPQSMRARASFLIASDSDSLMLLEEDVDTLIMDPPRAGVSPDVLEFLAQPDRGLALSRIIYLSCSFPSLRRDSGVLTRGEWKSTAAHAYVLFPGSDHVETLMVFDRLRSKKTFKPSAPSRRATWRPQKR